MPFTASTLSTITIRPSGPGDATDVARLAALDSARAPTGTLLLGFVDGSPVAALSVETGAVVADPFTHTAELVALLHQRAARLHPAPGKVARWRPSRPDAACPA